MQPPNSSTLCQALRLCGMLWFTLSPGTTSACSCHCSTIYEWLLFDKKIKHIFLCSLYTFLKCFKTVALLALQIYITVDHLPLRISVAFAPSPSHAQISDLIQGKWGFRYKANQKKKWFIGASFPEWRTPCHIISKGQFNLKGFVGAVLRCISISQNYLCRKYRFRDLALNIEVWKSLTFSPSFSPLTYIGWILLYNFVKKKRRKKKSVPHICQHFFLCLLAQADNFFVFPTLSEVYHNVLKKKSQDIFPRFWCPLIFEFILLSLFLIYFFPHFLKIIFREAETLVSSWAASNLSFTSFLNLQAPFKIHSIGFTLKGRTLIQSSQPPTLGLKGHWKYPCLLCFSGASIDTFPLLCPEIWVWLTEHTSAAEAAGCRAVFMEPRSLCPLER